MNIQTPTINYNEAINTLNYLERFMAADIADYFFIPSLNLINKYMTTHEVSSNILTQNQTAFLMSNKLLNVIDTDSFSYSYITTMFNSESSNIPLEDYVFLYSIFQFVNLYLYIHNPEYIIPTKNKKYNIERLPKVGMTFNNKDNSPSQKAQVIGFKYLINPYKRTMKLGITLYDNVFQFVVPINESCSVNAHSVSYKVDNPNDVLFNIVSIYEDIINAISGEELDLE